MTEEEFINSIDSNFPYYEIENAIETIAIASKFSEEAAFAVLNELVRIPKSITLTKDYLSELISIWERSSSSPLKPVLLKYIRDRIANGAISSKISVDVMNQIGKIRNSFHALNIVYFLGYCDEVDAKYNEIIELWKY